MELRWHVETWDKYVSNGIYEKVSTEPVLQYRTIDVDEEGGIDLTEWRNVPVEIEEV